MLAGGLYERTSGAAGQPLAGYRRREPERTVLHELVARHAQTMLAEVRAADPEGRGLRAERWYKAVDPDNRVVKATRISSAQAWQRTRAKPWASTPHRRYSVSSRST